MPVFALPLRLAAKADPALIQEDEDHFARIASRLAERIGDVTSRLDVLRRAPGGRGRAALDRDQDIHRSSRELRRLLRQGPEACLGRLVLADGGGTVYIGRTGVSDSDGVPLMIDWRAAAARPFFAATRANPLGVLSRRRYRWGDTRVIDYWDEVLVEDASQPTASLDDQSAFLASLGQSRTARMRDVLATIQADQDAIIRAGSRGALVVDGGPGTGKTVVALHRAAYLLYADPRLSTGRGGVLVVGPHRPYLAYVADVLPNLGEDGVRTCTLRDLVPQGADAIDEPDPEVARLKASSALLAAVEPAVALYEEPVRESLTVETPWCDVEVGPGEFQAAFEAVDPGTPHNEARDQVWAELLEVLLDGADEDVPRESLRSVLERDRELRSTFSRAWPILDATDLVSDLWSVPAYLRRCAPWLSEAERRVLQRPEGQAWTVEDLPILDAMRRRLGDPDASRRRRRRETQSVQEREYRAAIAEYLVAADEDGEDVVTMLAGRDLADALIEDEDGDDWRDPLAGPFSHIVVDEAQELTDAQWHLLLSRCPTRSFTIVGDRSQARHGFPETFQERLARVGFDPVRVATLSVNYRTPTEVMDVAEPVIRAVLPQANVPVSVRSSGVPVRTGGAGDLDAIVDDWIAGHAGGTACVVGLPGYPERDRVRVLSPDLVKGLEFDLVILVDPERFGPGVTGAVDRYVAMTRATEQLVILTSE